MLETPVYPDIRKGPPRFLWTKKHWKVDGGQTMKQVEHIPQLQESAILYQSYDYGKQQAYGNYPTYTTFVNKEFRPPLQDQDDFLPLSRIPRPTVTPRINPGGAFSNGNSVYSSMNISLPEADSYLTDRVKEGEIRPTFFCPIDVPVDNSILPDLVYNVPQISADAGIGHLPSVIQMPGREGDGWGMYANDSRMIWRDYKNDHSASAGYSTPYYTDAATAGCGRDEQVERALASEYNRPQISAGAGFREGFSTHISDQVGDIDEMQYNRPQVAAASGTNTLMGATTPVTDLFGVRGIHERDIDYNNPRTSAGSGYSGVRSAHTSQSNTTPVHMLLSNNKLEGNQAMTSGVKSRDFGGRMERQPSNTRTVDRVRQEPYVVPNSTVMAATSYDTHRPNYRPMAAAQSKYRGSFETPYIPTAGISTPQVDQSRFFR